MFFLQIFLSVVFADANLGVKLDPLKGNYTLTLVQHNTDLTWEGTLDCSRRDGFACIVPLKAAFFWGTSQLMCGKYKPAMMLLPFVPEQQACTYTNSAFDISFISFPSGQRGFGCTLGSAVSLFGWRGPFAFPKSFQVAWGAQYAPWGVAMKLSLHQLQVELLFTPITGLSWVLKQQVKASCFHAFITYGDLEYPLSYGWDFFMERGDFSVKFEREDAYGENPLYGGWYRQRKWMQTGTIHFASGKWFYQFVVKDTCLFSSDGRIDGKVVLHLQMGFSGCIFSLRQSFGRGSVGALLVGEETTLSVLFKHAALSYDLKVWKFSISDSFAVGKGTFTWKIIRVGGKRVDVQVLYQRPIH